MESAVNTNTTPPTNIITHRHGGAVCPYYGLVSVDLLNPTQGTSSEGVGQGSSAGFNINC
jgi:hypothetical protein